MTAIEKGQPGDVGLGIPTQGKRPLLDGLVPSVNPFPGEKLHHKNDKPRDNDWPINGTNGGTTGKDAENTPRREPKSEIPDIDLSATKADQPTTRPLWPPMDRRKASWLLGGVTVGSLATLLLKDPLKKLFTEPERKLVAAPLPQPKPSVEATPPPPEPLKEAFFGKDLTRSVWGHGYEYRDDKAYANYPLETTMRYYLLKDCTERERHQYEAALKDDGLMRMLARVHEVINGKSFEKLTPNDKYGKEDVELLEKGPRELLINSWGKSEFAKLDNLFSVFRRRKETDYGQDNMQLEALNTMKDPSEKTDSEQLRYNQEVNAAMELRWFLDQVLENPYPKTARVVGNRVLNEFTRDDGKKETWEYPTVTASAIK